MCIAVAILFASLARAENGAADQAGTAQERSVVLGRSVDAELEQVVRRSASLPQQPTEGKGLEHAVLGKPSGSSSGHRAVLMGAVSPSLWPAGPRHPTRQMQMRSPCVPRITAQAIPGQGGSRHVLRALASLEKVNRTVPRQKDGIWAPSAMTEKPRQQRPDVKVIEHSNTEAKALAINLNPGFYGSFAEIGAGTEVSRWFFKVGAAAGTVAKSVSAYDKTISDTMYGSAARYVTMDRLDSMLEYEYLNVLLPLRQQKGRHTTFFAFGNTITTRQYSRPNALCHGWLGLKFQTRPEGEPNKVLVHVRLDDKTAEQQQHVVGIFGVNLIYGCLFYPSDIDTMLGHLSDDLEPGRVFIDYMTLTGPDYKHVDQRLIALKLVQLGLAQAVLFQRNQVHGGHEQRTPDEAFYKKQLCVQRGQFFPLTNLHMEIQSTAVRQIKSRQEGEADPILPIYELTGPQLPGEPEEAFLARFDIVAATGDAILVSGFFRFFRLSDYLHTYTQDTIYITLGAPSLPLLFDESYYTGLAGGMLEAFGRLFSYDLKLLIFPLVADLENGTSLEQLPSGGKDMSAIRDLINPIVHPLFDYLLVNGKLELLERTFVSGAPMLSSGAVRRRFCEDGDWEEFVPAQVRSFIHRCLTLCRV